MPEFSLPQPVLFVLERMELAGFEAFVVGGAVRDMIINRPTNDWDFTTNAKPEDIQAIFPESFYDNQFGTVGIALEHIFPLMRQAGWVGVEKDEADPRWLNQTFEITTYRTDLGYSDHRRPDAVSWGKSLDEDLARRDFTVNAMAIEKKRSEKYTIIDPYEGQEDIKNQLIKAVGDPETRFEEDGLRMMRAIRFGAELGFSIEPYTLMAIKSKAHLIAHISW